MKKRKPPNQEKADFRNKPFSSLRGLAPSTVITVKESTSPLLNKKSHVKDEDDDSLFLRATEGARRIGNAPDSLNSSARGRNREKTTVRAPDDSRLFLAAVQKIGNISCDAFREREREEAEKRSSASRMRRLKRGDIRICRELDLHGFLKDEALKQLDLFIANAYSNQEQAVLVITGKGINSPEGPVLQGAVEDWLTSKGKGLIIEFSRAPRDLGGGGAFVVFLKQR